MNAYTLLDGAAHTFYMWHFIDLCPPDSEYRRMKSRKWERRRNKGYEKRMEAAKHRAAIMAKQDMVIAGRLVRVLMGNGFR